jgi:DNA-binding beta-propeller fold protein YncE
MRVGSGKFMYEVVEPWGQLLEGRGFAEVTALAVGANDRLYVFARFPHGILVFDRDGRFLAAWGEGVFKRPHGLFVGPDEAVYCVDDEGHALCKFTGDGKLQWTIETAPSDTGYKHYFPQTVLRPGPPFNMPTDVALSPDGDMYVTDGYGNCRVHKFAPDRRLLFSWGEPGGDGPGRMSVPHGIFVDKAGKVYVADRENQRIQIFSPKGEFLSQVKGVTRPCSLHVDAEGMMYIAELGLVNTGDSDHPKTSPEAKHGRVTVRNPSGEILAEWGAQDPQADMYFAPHAITMDSRGDLYMGQVLKSYSNGKAPTGRPTLHKYVRV